MRAQLLCHTQMAKVLLTITKQSLHDMKSVQAIRQWYQVAMEKCICIRHFSYVMFMNE